MAKIMVVAKIQALLRKAPKLLSAPPEISTVEPVLEG